jgi:hypothetical protein
MWHVAFRGLSEISCTRVSQDIEQTRIRSRGSVIAPQARRLARPMKKSVPLIAGLILAAGLAFAAQAEDRPAQTAVVAGANLGQVMILNLGKKADDFLKFHGRSSVKLSGLWKPADSDVAACEQLVQSYFGHSTRLLPRQFSEYHRQYLGIQRGRRRLLYLNAFYSNKAPGPALRERLVDAYDGGDNFWGLVCDPNAKKISEFEKNHGP